MLDDYSAKIVERIRQIQSTQAELSDSLTSIFAALLSIDPKLLPRWLSQKAQIAAYDNRLLRKKLELLRREIEKEKQNK